MFYKMLETEFKIHMLSDEWAEAGRTTRLLVRSLIIKQSSDQVVLFVQFVCRPVLRIAYWFVRLCLLFSYRWFLSLSLDAGTAESSTGMKHSTLQQLDGADWGELLLILLVCCIFTVCVTERSCSHDVQPTTLSELKRSDPGGVHHVRVQLRSYEPQRLHQALKLYCSKCTSM